MESTLSLFYKMLLLAEDRQFVSLDDFVSLGKTRPILGTLGRLESLGYLRRTKEKGQTVFKLAPAGDASLAEALSWLKAFENTWDGEWRIVLFKVPVSLRSLRQTFRLKLTDLGFRMLQPNVWISSSSIALEKFLIYLAQTKCDHYFTIFKAEKISEKSLDVAKLWQINSLDKEYKNLYERISSQLPRLKKMPHPTFEAKCLVVELALLAKKDPRLTPPLMPKTWIGNSSDRWYSKIRPYCALDSLQMRN